VASTSRASPPAAPESRLSPSGRRCAQSLCRRFRKHLRLRCCAKGCCSRQDFRLSVLSPTPPSASFPKMAFD
jgi:hypothetical protein